MAGRDLEKMGTWMGVTKNGRFAALTNYRDPNEKTENKKSRGELVSDFLTEDTLPKSYLENIQKTRNEYPGFNLILGDINGLYYYSNVENEITLLQPGIYGVSNHLLNTNWPKVQKGRIGLETCLKSQSDNLKECLFSSLEDADPASDEELPHTGVSLDWERRLSSLFIQSEEYGTRSSTVLFMNKEKVEFVERTFNRKDFLEKEFI